MTAVVEHTLLKTSVDDGLVQMVLEMVERFACGRGIQSCSCGLLPDDSSANSASSQISQIPQSSILTIPTARFPHFLENETHKQLDFVKSLHNPALPGSAKN